VITCSLGIASLEKEGEELNTMKAALIEGADTAMYRAKDLGNNQVCLAEPSSAS
jgi:PleD family two-component response regulator